MKNIENLLNEVLTIEEGNKLQQIYKDIFVSECSEYGSIEEVAEAIESEKFCCENEVLEMVQKYFKTYGYNNIGLDANNLVWLTFEFMVIGWYYDIKDYIYNID